MRVRLWWLVPAMLLALAGGALAASDDPKPPSKPLPRASIVIDSDSGPARFTVEVAGDPQSQAYGLMNRKSLGANAGMLFDFHQPVMTSFWMKNTLIPLDMIFIRPDGVISSIAAEAEPLSLTSIPCIEPVRAVLEIKGGRAAELNIYPGQRVHGAIFGRIRH